MQIVYATLQYSGRDVTRGSGSAFYMTRELERQGHSIYYVDAINTPIPVITRLLKRASVALKKQYKSHLDPFFCRIAGQTVMRKISTLEFDAFITNDYGIAGNVQSKKPIILWTDAVFPYMYYQNIHPWLSNLSFISVKFAQHVIQQGVLNASYCFLASEWGVQELRKYPKLRGKNIRIEALPYGANLDDPSINISLNRRFSLILKKARLDILFIGTDWSLKGGDIAIKIIEELRKCGIDAHLHLVGALPPYPVNSSYVQCYGRLDKADHHHTNKLDSLYKRCDIFLLPTIVEGFGVVFAEAAAYGLPSIAYATTGVQTAVKDGQSGVLVPPASPPEAFSQIIQGWFTSPADYDRLVTGARQHYEKLVNWETTVSTLLSKVRQG